MTAQPPEDPNATPSPDDEPATGGTAWWWSPGLMLVVGVAVIGFQVDAYGSPGGGMWLNAVMIGVGAVVAVLGARGLWRGWQEQQAGGDGTTPR